MSKLYVVESKTVFARKWNICKVDVERKDYPRKSWRDAYGRVYRLVRYVREIKAAAERIR